MVERLIPRALAVMCPLCVSDLIVVGYTGGYMIEAVAAGINATAEKFYDVSPSEEKEQDIATLH